MTYVLSSVQYPIRFSPLINHSQMAPSASPDSHAPEFEQWVCIICNKPISHGRPPVLNLDNCSCSATATASIGTDSEIDSEESPRTELRRLNGPTSHQNQSTSAQTSSSFLPISPASFYECSENSNTSLPFTLHRYLSSQPKDDPAMLAVPDKEAILQQGVFEATTSMCATGKGSLESSVVSSRSSSKVLGMSGQVVGIGEWAGEEGRPERIEELEELEEN